MGVELKRLPAKASSFEANGNRYKIGEDLSVFRHKVLERLQVIAAFGSDLPTLFGKATDAYNSINALKAADAAVHLNGLLEGTGRALREEEPALLLICSLFISREGENLATWDEADARLKIADWEAEGYAMRDFFALALDLQRAYNNLLGSTTPLDLQDLSEEEGG